MAADRRVYDSRHLPADCCEPGSAPEPYNRVLVTFTFLHTPQIFANQTVGDCGSLSANMRRQCDDNKIQSIKSINLFADIS